MLVAAVERFVSGFFEKRRTSMYTLVFSYVGYYLVSAAAFLFLGIPLVSMIISIVSIFLMTFNYESFLIKRFFATLGIFAITIVVEAASMVVLGIYVPSLLEEVGLLEAGFTWQFIVLGLILYLLALIFRRLKFIKKNTAKILPSLLWGVSLIIPVASIALSIFLLGNFPQGLGILSLIALFLFNMFTFYMHDTLAAFHEEKNKNDIN